MRRIRVGFHEETRHPAGDGRTGQHRDELALAAGTIALPARQLHRVGGVKDHRAAGLAHDGQRPHVGDQIVVAEAGATLADHHAVLVDTGVPRRGPCLGHDLHHVVRRQELALLDVDGPAAGSHGVDEVGLAAQEGRRLQHVHHLGHGLDLIDLVDIGDDGHTDLALDLGQHLQPALKPRPPEGLAGAAVGLVERRLVDEGDVQLGADFLELAGGVECQLQGLDGARPGQQEEGLVKPGGASGDLHECFSCEAWLSPAADCWARCSLA